MVHNRLCERCDTHRRGIPYTEYYRCLWPVHGPDKAHMCHFFLIWQCLRHIHHNFVHWRWLSYRGDIPYTRHRRFRLSYPTDKVHTVRLLMREPCLLHKLKLYMRCVIRLMFVQPDISYSCFRLLCSLQRMYIFPLVNYGRPRQRNCPFYWALCSRDRIHRQQTHSHRPKNWRYMSCHHWPYLSVRLGNRWYWRSKSCPSQPYY